jgi:23S rRNA (uracil1939-C5)-methyltransferase
MSRRPTTSRQHGTRKPTAAANAAPGRPTPSEQHLDIEKAVDIEKAIYGGAFLARHEGKAIFIPLALPGEQAQVRIVEEKKSYAAAEIIRIATPAPERVIPECRHFGACGGCQYQHASYEAQLRFKQSILRETLERGGVRAPDSMTVLAAEPWQYRNRIRLALDAAGNPGYRGRRSHRLVPIAECPIAMSLLVRAALAAGEIMRALTPSRRATELSLFCDAEGTALLASLSAPASFSLHDFCRALAERIPQLTGAELAAEDPAGRHPRGDSRTPLAAPGKALWGAPSLTYRAAGYSYRVDHGAFFQVNHRLIDALVDRVLGGGDGEDAQGALAWDLFAGVGLFARRLAGRFTRVLAVESAPSAAAALAQNLAGTGGEPVYATTLDFLRRVDASRPGKIVPGRIVPDLIIVDPPRAGLEAETTALLARIAAPALTYVSCDPATLARDLRPLLDAGYVISDITLADLFPQTFHIETVVHLRRSRANT